jgi:hypothetical protein
MDDLRACADTTGMVINPYDRYAGFARFCVIRNVVFSARTRPVNICRHYSGLPVNFTGHCRALVGGQFPVVAAPP